MHTLVSTAENYELGIPF